MHTLTAPYRTPDIGRPMTTTAIETPKASPTEAALRTLGIAGDRLYAVIEDLERRLMPIMSPAAPRNSAEAASDSPIQLVNAILAHEQRIIDACSRIEAMLGRLAI